MVLTWYITAYCSITWSYLERGLWVKDLYSYKIMIKSMTVNSARGTLKVKRNSMSFSWCLGQHNPRTKVQLNWCGVNNPQELLTSGNSSGKARLPPFFGRQKIETPGSSDSRQRRSFRWSLWSSFVFFLFFWVVFFWGGVNWIYCRSGILVFSINKTSGA